MKRVAALIPVLFLGACGGVAGEAGYAAEALDSTDVSSTESALMATSNDALEGSSATTAESAAQTAATRWPTFYQPAGCATATYSGDTATFTLKDCTGRYGLVHVTGTVTVVYTKTATGWSGTASGVGLSVNGATVDLNANGTFSNANGVKTADIQSTSKGTGVRGNAFTRSGAYTASWDGSCLTLDGSWMTTVNARHWTTTVSNFKRCTGMCPQAGSTVTYTGGVLNLSVTITADGDNTANWSTSTGKMGTLTLFCKP
jgi:Tfp pilus assembly protein PilV